MVSKKVNKCADCSYFDVKYSRINANGFIFTCSDTSKELIPSDSFDPFKIIYQKCKIKDEYYFHYMREVMIMLSSSDIKQHNTPIF